MTEDELLTLAAERYAASDLAGAAELYAEVVRRNSKHAHALYMSGSVAYRGGEFSKACDLFRQAVGVAPKRPEYHNALGLALIELRDYGEAESSILRAIRLSS